MEPYLGFLVATTVGVGLAATQLVIARRTGLAPYQASLISTLTANVSALTERVDQLEKALADEQAKRRAATTKVEELEDAVSDLARENTALRRKAGLDPR